VQNQGEAKDVAGLLEAIPVLSSCTRNVLDEFVSHAAVTECCAAGTTLSAEADEVLYVLVAGSALLDAGDDVVIDLEPGDYFGGTQGRRFKSSPSLIAVTDVEVLAVHPDEVTWLKQASARDRHPSQVDWRSQLATTSRKKTRRNHRRAILSSQGN
jgi:CRP-like cAMP-binding protein